MRNKLLLYTGIIFMVSAIVLAFIMGSSGLDTSRFNTAAIILQVALILGALSCLGIFFKKN